MTVCRAASQLGGGIYNGGTLTLIDSPVTNNNAGYVRPLPARRAPAGRVRARRRQEELARV